MTKHFHVTTPRDAWKLANELTPCDYCFDQTKTDHCGYPVYDSINIEICYFWIDDLNDRLEINLPNETINIWIDSVLKSRERETLTGEKSYSLQVIFSGALGSTKHVDLDDQTSFDFEFWKTVSGVSEIVDNSTGEIVYSVECGINERL